MRIARVHLRRVDGRLARPVATGRSVFDERCGLWFALQDAEGRLGQGEASPLPGYSPDTLEEAMDALGRVEGPLDLDALDGVTSPSARFALETALLDLIGQMRGVPLRWLLGAAPEPGPRPLCALALDLDGARAAVARGVGCLKLKIGRDLDGELALLDALRRELGDGVQLRLDANGSLPPADAPALLRELVRFRPELVEEPVAELDALDRSPVPLALDESLQRADRARLARLLGRGDVAALVLKPMALGGALRCLELARAARDAGAAAIVSHLLDGPLALRAAAELALALPAGPAVGLDAHPGLGAWPALPLPMLGPAHVLPVALRGLGHGAP